MNNILFFIVLIVSFLPFVLFAFLNSKANVKKENRNKQYVMPLVAVAYSVVLLIFLDKLSSLITDLFLKLADLFNAVNLPQAADFIKNLYTNWGIYLSLVLFNTAALLLYIVIKRLLTLILSKIAVKRETFIGSVVELFYSYDDIDGRWYIKEHFGQACMFAKIAYYGSCFVSGLVLLVSCGLCMAGSVSAPFYPVFAVIIIGEMAFYLDGMEKDLNKSDLAMQSDKSRHVVMYPLLRKPLKALFSDKLSAEGTTVNTGGISGGSIEDILVDLERNGGHIGRNYATFIRKKMELGLKPNIDYVRCGYDLSVGKSLLFNTPFYDKLNPYACYAMNRELLTGGKVLIVLGRHGTEDDLLQWTESGMKAVSNIPNLWNITVLSGKKINEDSLPDIGIISRSGVHDLDIHKNNQAFLRKVSFVFIVEPSKLVTTAQIGLNLLVKCCGKDRPITFCSVDRNCDGLVDALSHIIMTNLTEVSATEYPHGMSSFMYWTSDDVYPQHRILPGISRFLGMGTVLSAVALKNQVRKTVWYGGEAFPVLDAHWIAKQYYYDLLNYAQLPTTQETFDNCFQASFNMCNERVSDYSFITVEDDRNNLFEIRRNFATIADQQGFVNVISSEYMLREYMSANTEIFTSDPKAIPYITADYARTKRNAILSICLLLCIDSVKEDVLLRQLSLMNLDTKEPIAQIWKEICIIFGRENLSDRNGIPILCVNNIDGNAVRFERDDTIIFKRVYSVESGKFESVYTIENSEFSRIILYDLQNASYIAEQESRDVYIGSELKGHIYQKYLPGQFFTLNGKYYEMVSAASDNRIMVRRAADHIVGRLYYRQIRNYKINNLEDVPSMGALKSVNNIDIHYQYADFSVDTPGYWKLRANNDFDNGDLVELNGIPTREYHHKQVLKFDFSRFGDVFTDSVRMTLTNLLNEAFVTLFADNQAYISAVTPGYFDAPLTYRLELDENLKNADKCIFIIEDSQLDIGLLIAVERNVYRILNIIADYLNWNDEQIAESLTKKEEPKVEKPKPAFDVYSESEETESQKSFFTRFGDKIKKTLKKDGADKDSKSPSESEDALSPKERKKAAKKAEREEKKKRKQEEKLRRAQEKSSAEEVKNAEENSPETEPFAGDIGDVELQTDTNAETDTIENQNDGESVTQESEESVSEDEQEVSEDE